MKFRELDLKGAYLIEPEKIEDDRGYFARVWCREEFERRGLETRIAQCSVSLNRQRGTLRGLHWQLPPYPEVKVIRCTRGEIVDVLVDLRVDSRTCRRWTTVTLSEANAAMAYIPIGFLHGFQTLKANTEVLYYMSESYRPDYQSGVRWDDPTLKIKWPIDNPILSSRDMSLPLLQV